VHSKPQTKLVILTCTGLLLPLAIIAATQAQAPPPDDPKPPQVESVAAQSPFIAERAPRPIAEVNAFIEGSSRTNDAAIEIRLGSSRLLTFKLPLAKPGGDNPVIAFSDPRIADFEILPNNRMLRLVGLRPGNSDLQVITSDGEVYSFLVNVVFDLAVLRTMVKEQFPTATVSINQLREHLILTGQTRSSLQSREVTTAITALIPSILPERIVEPGATDDPKISVRIVDLMDVVYDLDAIAATTNQLYPDASVSIHQHAGDILLTGQVRTTRQAAEIEETIQTLLPNPSAVRLRIMNRLQIPGPNQVMLRVQVAELNRTAMREIGASFLFSDANSIITSPVGGALPLSPDIADSNVVANAAGLSSVLTAAPAAAASALGIFDSADFAVLFRVLRENSFMKILAEPNLIAMNGHEASFLAGGEIPIVVGGAFGTNTIEYKQFGVQLEFTPTILPDDTIRLRVAPEVSSLDFANALTLQVGASPIPGLISRRVDTTVELREGQTLMLAGLLQVDLDAQTQRIPGLGDLPVLGTFFRNSTSRSVEKELVVMVTPYIVDAIDEDDAPALPGDDIQEANESEFYLYGRIEGCAAGFRSTTDYPRCRELIRISNRFIQGPHGYSNCDNCR